MKILVYNYIYSGGGPNSKWSKTASTIFRHRYISELNNIRESTLDGEETEFAININCLDIKGY